VSFYGGDGILHEDWTKERSMNPWFGKKKTPDGTVIIRHDAVEKQIGFTDKNTADFIQARETA
jgi:hypothetical protein